MLEVTCGAEWHACSAIEVNSTSKNDFWLGNLFLCSGPRLRRGRAALALTTVPRIQSHRKLKTGRRRRQVVD